jgi:hypothetical protein
MAERRRVGLAEGWKDEKKKGVGTREYTGTSSADFPLADHTHKPTK